MARIFNMREGKTRADDRLPDRLHEPIKYGPLSLDWNEKLDPKNAAPVASLPGITLESGGLLALVTQGPTPYDTDAEVKLDGDVVAELDAVMAAL